LIVLLGLNPFLGVKVPEYKNTYKVRLGTKGMGKQGGFRVYYHYEKERIKLLTIFSKSEQEDEDKAKLSKTQKQEGIF